MATNEIHVGDIGLTFEITVKDQNSSPIDLSQATVKKFYFLKPDGENLIVDASLVNDGEDGLLRYVFRDGDIDKTGNWKYQVLFGFGATRYWTDIGKFKVYPNIT